MSPDRPAPHAGAAPSQSTPPGFRAGAALTLLGLVCAALLFFGVQMTRAGLADYQTRAFLADWEAKAAEPSARAWEVAHDAATRAVVLYPVANGAYLERLGYVHLWQHFRQPFGAPAARASRVAARGAFRAAAQARPTWPYAWAGLAEAKLGLLEFDAEFHHALARARALGPWRPGLNQRLAKTGFIAWPQLDAGQRQATLESARRALQLGAAGAAQLFAFADAARQLAPLCGKLDAAQQKRHARHCAPAR